MTTSLDILVKATDQASATLKGVTSAGSNLDKTLTGTNATAKKTGGFFSSAAGKLALFGGGAIVAKKVFDVFSTGVKDAQEADRVFAGLTSTLKGMGRPNAPEALKDVADGLESTTGFTSESIQEGERLLATFGNISDKLLTDVTPSMVDFAAQFTNGNMEGAATMLGKALDNPIKGLTAMSKAGVSFSAEQTEMVKGMMEAGDIAGAQGVILEALGPQIEGAGVASQTSGKKFSNSFGNMAESASRLLMPAISAVSGIAVTFFDALSRGSPIALGIVGAIGALAAVMTVLKIQTALASGEGLIFATVSAAQKIATVASTAAQWLFNAAMTANPIGLVIAAITAVVAGIVLFATKTEIGRKIFGAAFNAIKAVAMGVFNVLKTAVTIYFDIWKGIFNVAKTIALGVFNAVKDVGKAIWEPISDAFRTAWQVIKGVFNTLKGFLIGGWNAVKDVGVGIWDVIKGAAIAVFNGIATIWNNTVGKLSFRIPSFIPGIGGKGWDVPDIPTFAEGGIATKPTFGVFGERGPEALIPLGAGAGMGTTNIYVAGSVIAERELLDIVKKQSNRSAARNAGRSGVN